jgi:glycosyltransferase involved in cell wall biosynthesis
MTYPQAKLLLVGSLESELDPLRVETLEAIKHCSQIISVGYQNDVRPYLAVSDCLVFPSYREGFPNVVMQAGAMELPSIVSDINGCNEIIIDTKNGLIIPAKSEQKLLEAMQWMMEEEEERLRMKQNARPMIVDRYEQKVVWEAILREYEEFCG